MSVPEARKQMCWDGYMGGCRQVPGGGDKINAKQKTSNDQSQTKNGKDKTIKVMQ